ncbi:Rdx family protein [bacterium]|nr:Rdx family protein [bacterium]MBU1636909.1 Rdx family protein [bacterium]MBU1920105.1 Rdx family protein [bacterium]
MAEAIEKAGYPKPELIKSGGGAFEVRKDGVLLFSKLSEGRFPEPMEIIDLIKDKQ